jgi:DNA ligase-1
MARRNSSSVKPEYALLTGTSSVREVAPEIVLEIAFDSVHRSTRHKSGVAMRFPRIHRIRWDKPLHEADTLEALEKLLT